MIKKLLQKAKSENIEIEIFKNRDKTTSVKVYNEDLESFDSHDITIYDIKAIYNNKTINIRTENINEVDQIIDIIKTNALLIENSDKNELATTKKLISVDLEEDKVNYNEIIDELTKLYKLKEKYTNLVSIDTNLESVFTEYAIYNENVSLEDKNKYYAFEVELVMEFNGINKTNYKYFYDKKLTIEKINKLVEELIEETISKETTSSIETKKYNIILDKFCVNKLLKHFSSIFSAEEINKKTSILTDKFNEKIFSDKITIIEDPQNELYVGKRLFDTEGTETQYKVIVENGIFKTKLYDNKNAIKENIKSTGNSFGVRNMYIKPGIKTQNELLCDLKNGIYLTNIEGLHAGINNTTGDISLQSEGYIVKDSKLKEFLNMIIISTNIFELFNNIIEVGNDLEFMSLSCGAPSLLINSITIAGDK